jgi:hypothetical protein
MSLLAIADVGAWGLFMCFAASVALIAHGQLAPRATADNAAKVSTVAHLRVLAALRDASA